MLNTVPFCYSNGHFDILTSLTYVVEGDCGKRFKNVKKYPSRVVVYKSYKTPRQMGTMHAATSNGNVGSSCSERGDLLHHGS